jgi:hypothetical protein
MSQQNQQPASEALILRTDETRPEPSATPQVPELPSFTYDAINPNFIRTLVPDLTTDPGSHTWLLETVHLDALDYEYEALSYIWGSQANSFPITLNGRLVHVHSNLFSALPYLAHRGGVKPVRPIWIDAVCINQANEEEKMAQIRLMNKIYRRARTV